MMKKLSTQWKSLLPLTLCLALLGAAAAVPLKSQPGAGSVTFLATGQPSALKIRGTSTGGPTADLRLEGSQIKGTTTFDLDKLDSGIQLRTTHMKEKYLQVKEYPQAKLTLLDAPVDSDFAKTLSLSGEKAFKGKLSLHGKEHEVAGTFSAKDGLLKAKFPLTLTDYGIDVPKYLGITVASTVEVNAEIPLRK